MISCAANGLHQQCWGANEPHFRKYRLCPTTKTFANEPETSRKRCARVWNACARVCSNHRIGNHFSCKTAYFTPPIPRATTFFHLYNDWPWTSALYYAIDTGLSIGFGALQPKVHGLGAANIQPLRQLIFSPLGSS